MAFKPSLLTFLLCAFIPIVSASIGLGADTRAHIPVCAQPCLLTFVQSNFPTANCGSDYSLSCLCSTPSKSGFTLGEGALQCLLGDLDVGQCTESDLTNSSSSTALHMCDGQASALPITHTILTATIVLGPSGSASLIQSTPTQTTTITTTQTQTHTTSITSSPTPSLASTSSRSFPTMTSSTATSSPTSTSKPPSSTALSTPQVVGISVGVAGAIGFAVIAIFLARCIRNRRYSSYSDSEKGYSPSLNGGSFDPVDSRGSRIFHISPPILRTSRYKPDFTPRPAPPVPSVYQPGPATPARDNPRRSTIGLAISRPRSLIPSRASRASKASARLQSPIASPRPVEVPVERRSSKLLPPRPALTLDIPQPRTVAMSTISSQPPRTTTTDRTSTLTNMTAFADLDAEAAEGGQIWRPPSSNPQSATALYVADKYGNWVLASGNHLSRLQLAQVTEAAELDTYTPLTKSPIEKLEEAAAAKMAAAISAASSLPAVPQPAFLNQDPALWTNSWTSSYYSQGGAPRHSGRRNSAGRGSFSRLRKGSGGPKMMDRSNSQASATTIQTSSSGVTEDPSYEGIARLSQLSPVEESPDPAIGRSQVTYPRIPGRLDGATIRYVPPPKRPDFTGSPPGQPSPTLGVVLPVRESPSAYPSPLKPKRITNRPYTPTQKVGSGFSPESVNIEVFTSQISSPSPMGTPTTKRTSRSSGGASVQAMQSPRQATARQQQGVLLQTPTQRPVATFTPSPPSNESRRQQPSTPTRQGSQERGETVHIAMQQAVSPVSARTVSSTTSSLLAKRLGNDRAAAFTTLDSNNAKKAQQWRRKGDGGLLSPDAAGGFTPQGGTLPMTPTWQPRLTPTRRGDDLYLNVQ
ncbi:hypothetical protein F5Y16DRAFT_242394 [Xylariaceae sp. FL0255]|nr:hypothetical protein F5Y16DRAFT_242394 [Xylariaceae sp. FL0255]